MTKTDIIFDIDLNGNITITVEGVKGQSCTDLTKQLEEALGVVLDQQHTSEYYLEEENKLTITLGKDDE